MALLCIVSPMPGRAIHGVMVGQVGPEGALSTQIRPWAGLGACFKYIFDSDRVYACTYTLGYLWTALIFYAE